MSEQRSLETGCIHRDGCRRTTDLCYNAEYCLDGAAKKAERENVAGSSKTLVGRLREGTEDCCLFDCSKLQGEAADEIERLQQCLAIANSNHERFEREWYLRGDEIERLQREKAQALEFLCALISGGVNQDFRLWARELYGKLYGLPSETPAAPDACEHGNTDGTCKACKLLDEAEREARRAEKTAVTPEQKAQGMREFIQANWEREKTAVTLAACSACHAENTIGHLLASGKCTACELI